MSGGDRSANVGQTPPPAIKPKQVGTLGIHKASCRNLHLWGWVSGKKSRSHPWSFHDAMSTLF